MLSSAPLRRATIAGLRELGPTLAVAAAALLVQLPIYDRGIFLLDEGYMLQLADAIDHGKVLYRDVNVDAPFPGAFYLLAAWFRVAGTSVWVSRLLVVAIFVAFAALVFRIAREVASLAWALGLAVVVLCYRVWAFPHWHMLSYSSVAATLLFAALLAVLVHVRRGTPATALAAGLLAGLGLVCKQDYGVGVGAALGLFLLVRPFLRRGTPGFAPAARYAAGVALVVVPVLVAFALAGALAPLVQQTIVRPYAAMSRFPYARLPDLLPFVAQDRTMRADIGLYLPAILTSLHWDAIVASPTYRDTALWDVALKLVYWAPIAIVALAALVWVGPAVSRARAGVDRPDDERRLAVLAAAGGFLVAFNRPRDWVHLMMIYPAALLVATTLAAGLPRLVRRPLGAIAWIAIAAAVVVSASLVVDLREQHDTRLALPRGGVLVNAPLVQLIEDVVRYVDDETSPATPVPVLPLHPMINFLAAREGVGGFYVVWPVFQDPQRDARMIDDLERRNVDVVVYSISQYAHLGTFRENAPRLYDYLAAHYTIERVFSREVFGNLFCALRRRRPEPASTMAMYDVAPGYPGDGTVAPATWPFFTRVMAQRIGTAASPSVERFGLPLPGGRPRLLLRYGVNPERWLDPPSGPYTFRIALEEDGEAPRTLLERTLDPQRRVEDRAWPDAALDLSEWAGRRVAVSFEVAAPEEPPRRVADTAGWAEPRIAVE